MARREERAYREYVSDEQRSQPGCPARELCDESLLRDTSPSSKKWRGASMCVPAWALMCSVDTLELSPRATRLIGSRANGVLFGYVGSCASRATVTSMSFI